MSGSKLSPPSAARTAPPSQNESLVESLGMTVHSLSVPRPAASSPRIDRFGGRVKMLIVMLICAAPVIASYLTYYVIRPEGRRNFGQMIDPQQALPDLQALALDGKSQDLRELKGQWLLVSVASGACDESCEKHLYLQRQLLTSLGKERARFDWVWLVSDDQPVRSALLPALKEATVLRVPASAVANWLAPEAKRRLEDHLYVVDPLGNWMMRFPAKLDTTGAASAKRDMERLLRASASWDEPGRTGTK